MPRPRSREGREYANTEGPGIEVENDRLFLRLTDGQCVAGIDDFACRVDQTLGPKNLVRVKLQVAELRLIGEGVERAKSCWQMFG